MNVHHQLRRMASDAGMSTEELLQITLFEWEAKRRSYRYRIQSWLNDRFEIAVKL